MTKIYLVRHAEAEGNVYRRIHGQYDSRITPNGLRQVEALRTRFQGIPIDACYASDLNRTCVTARSVYLPKGLELRRDRRFREVDLGRWEDIPFGWLERFEPERMTQFNKEPQLWSVKDSETFPEYTQRFLTALREDAEENDGKTIAVFTHGCVLRGVQYLLGGNEWPPYCDNTAVSLLDYENGAFQIEYLNDSSHLSDEISTFARQKWWRTGGDRRDFNMWFETEGETSYAVLRDRRVGHIRVSGRGCEKGELHIEDIFLEESHRGRALGAQLLGQAVSLARKMGCGTLAAAVPDEMRRALHFFERQGFLLQSETDGAAVLKMDISVPQK
ncbi:MAG: bifunctional histidine phosphatase family protein/GNAT family N-acetyltransferase [Firmicutes bacterium]|nr:bifunctional histidine phosphatase family protein/GNAT family N-acetyltransferase [Bacillota bacterium]